MEQWQEKLWKEFYNKNFLDDKDIINQVFEELCQPIINVGNKLKCKYEGCIDSSEYTTTSRLRITKNNIYELTIASNYLMLCFGYEYNDSNGEKTIKPSCIIKYKIIEDGEEIYRIEVTDKKSYGKNISHDFELGKDTILYKEKDCRPFEFNEDGYKMIINNLMDIAVTGTLDGEKLFEKNTQ